MARAPIRIIGAGNPLMGDDGIGIAAIERLQQQSLAPHIELIDAGCGGLSLVPLLAECREAIIIDAADFGATPGSIRTLTHNDLALMPPHSSRLTSHQPGLAEVIMLSKKLAQLPRLTLILIQVQVCALQFGLSAPVQAALPDLIETVLRAVQAAQARTPQNYSRTIG